MKEYLATLVRESDQPMHGRHLVREYLQARILGSLQRVGAMIPLAFHNGTALRFLYQIPRYSEDLDFALERTGRGYNFRAYLKAVRSDLLAEAYPVEVTVNERRVVNSAFVRFRGLLHELDLSSHEDEVLSIKIEVDTRAPASAVLETTIVRRYEILQLQHHDRASLLAGKLHAILQRPYTKGRDIYDLFWYLSSPEWPSPNLDMLNAALTQTDWSGGVLTPENWRGYTWKALDRIDWQRAVADVRPFLMEPNSVSLLTKENLIGFLSD